MTSRQGIWGYNALTGGQLGKQVIPSGKGHFNSKGAVFSANTNVHPAFGMSYKIKRNRSITVGTTSVASQTWGIHSRKLGINVFGDIQNKLSDPLHRDPQLLLVRARQESSIAGRSRAMMRPAAPQQVNWKNSYWIQERTRGRRGTTIGPYGQTSSKLPAQSMLSRVNNYFTGGGS